MLKAVLLTILSCLLLLLIPALMAASTVTDTLLKPYALNGYIEKSGLYRALAEYITTELEKAGPGEGEAPPEEGQQQFMEAISASVREVATPEWLAERATMLEGRIWDYLLEKSDTIDPIPIAELQEAVVHRYDERIASNPAVPNLVHAWRDSIPRELNVMQVYQMNEDQLEQLRDRYGLIRDLRLTLLVVCITVVWMGVLVAWHLKTVLRWIGCTALVTGILIAALFRWLLSVDFRQVIPLDSISQDWAGFRDGLLELGTQLLTDSIRQMEQFGWLLLIGGGLLILVSYIRVARREDGYPAPRKPRRSLMHWTTGVRIAGCGLFAAVMLWEIAGFVMRYTAHPH